MRTKKLAFVFPGQGSQSVGMLDAWGDHPAVSAVLEEASEALSQDLRALIASGTKEDLALTTNTQPVMLVADVAAYRAWRAEGGVAPDLLAGHSLGEYAAWVVSGVLTLAQAAPLVRLRAAAMQEAVAVGAGAMAAILGLEAAKVSDLCAQVTQSFEGAGGAMRTDADIVEVANLNDPLQTVIAGSIAAVEKACLKAKAAGAKRALLLPVSAPFHCRLMYPAAQKLKSALQELRLGAPQIPVINNVDVGIETDADRIKDALYRQAYRPVRWVETVQEMQTRGMAAIIECGPGKVLTGMSKRIAPQMPAAALYDPESLAQVQALLATL